MINNYINLAQVTTITLKRKRKIWFIKYSSWTIKNNFFNRFFKRDIGTHFGYTDSFGESNAYTDESIKKLLETYNAYIDHDDKEIYYYPFADIWLSNKHHRELYFKTVDELEEWARQVILTVPTIVILN